MKVLQSVSVSVSSHRIFEVIRIFTILYSGSYFSFSCNYMNHCGWSDGKVAVCSSVDRHLADGRIPTNHR
jgi:hypothetical protein